MNKGALVSCYIWENYRFRNLEPSQKTVLLLIITGPFGDVDYTDSHTVKSLWEWCFSDAVTLGKFTADLHAVCAAFDCQPGTVYKELANRFLYLDGEGSDQ